MNAKKVKQIRRALREVGVNFKEAQYDYKEHIVLVSKKHVLLTDSPFESKTYKTSQCVLKEYCGRSEYKLAKAAA